MHQITVVMPVLLANRLHAFVYRAFPKHYFVYVIVSAHFASMAVMAAVVVTSALLLWFVGAYYVAWIDRTGFVGKMNGLWRLNGASGDALDFVIFEGDRPVNFFIVGENGQGEWPAGYPGSEHAEFPNTTPEPNDNPACADGDWCNQYAHEEASDITDGDIPWWSACNPGTVGWTTVFEPVRHSVE